MRGHAQSRDPGLTQRVHGKKEDASFQVIVLVRSLFQFQDTHLLGHEALL